MLYYSYAGYIKLLGERQIGEKELVELRNYFKKLIKEDPTHQLLQLIACWVFSPQTQKLPVVTQEVTEKRSNQLTSSISTLIDLSCQPKYHVDKNSEVGLGA